MSEEDEKKLSMDDELERKIITGSGTAPSDREIDELNKRFVEPKERKREFVDKRWQQSYAEAGSLEKDSTKDKRFYFNSFREMCRRLPGLEHEVEWFVKLETEGRWHLVTNCNVNPESLGYLDAMVELDGSFKAHPTQFIDFKQQAKKKY